MKSSARATVYMLVGGTALVSLLLAVIPFFLMLAKGTQLPFSLVVGIDMVVALGRTAVICILSCVTVLLVCVIQGTGFAYGERAVGWSDFVLLAPLFSGEVVFGFGYKYLFGTHALLSHAGPLLNLIAFYSVHVLCFGLLFGQLATLLIFGSAEALADARIYFKSIGASSNFFLRAYVLPQNAILIAFTCFLLFAIVGQQAALTKFAFQPSPAQSNELWPHVIDRMVRQLSSSAALETIGGYISASSMLAGASLVICAFGMVLVLPFLLGGLSSFTESLPRRLLKCGNYVLRGALWINFLWVIAVALVLLDGGIGVASKLGESFVPWAISLLFAGCASLITVALSAMLSAFMLWNYIGRGGKKHSIVVLVAALLGTLFIPKKAIATGLVSILLKNQTFVDMLDIAVPIFWIATHAITLFPLCTIYMVAMMQSTTEREVSYLRSNGAKYRDLVVRFIAPRYMAEIVIVWGFCCIIAVLDFPINQIFYTFFEDQVQPLSEVITNATEGRGASTAIAASSVLLCLGATSLLLLFFQRLSRVGSPRVAERLS